jgi:hypothetical protein
MGGFPIVKYKCVNEPRIVMKTDYKDYRNMTHELCQSLISRIAIFMVREGYEISWLWFSGWHSSSPEFGDMSQPLTKLVGEVWS